MKRILVLVCLVMTGAQALPQDRRYTKAMQKAIEKMDAAEGREAHLRIVESFLEIARDYPDRWLPWYYAALNLTTMSFDEPGGRVRDKNLDRAQALLDSARTLNPDESEIYVLQALTHQCRLLVDPETRAMTEMHKSSSALAKAKSLNPDNPRIYFLEAMNVLNTPDFMGGGQTGAKPFFEKAEEKFKSFERKDPLWPGWGEQQTREQLEAIEANAATTETG